MPELIRRNHGCKPVKLEFSRSLITKANFPDYTTLKSYMYYAKKYWEESGNKKSIEFFNHACKVLESENIHVLRISDFNTTGLTGSDDIEENLAWFSMLCSEGVSNKTCSNSGSYGIGKSSIYVASSLRTVFFNAYDKDGKSSAQGVSKLATFITNGEKKFGNGFYGVLQSGGSTTCCETIDEKYEMERDARIKTVPVKWKN